MNEEEIRMNAMVWALVAEMNAIVVRVEGMRQANEFRKSVGYSAAYSEESFVSAENDLMEISRKLSEHI